MADAKHRLAYALLRATQHDFERGDIDKARARGEESLRLATALERPSETVMARAALLRCAISKGVTRDIKHHAEALGKIDAAPVAAYVRRAADQVLSSMKGVVRGTRAR
jgi:hypothetical protein